MFENTPLLNLPYLAAAQAQKHVTHNEALRMLDAVVHIGVVSRTVATPPDAPQEGDRYIVPASGSTAWNLAANTLAAFQDGYWETYAPRAGWVAYVSDAAALMVFDGTDWVAVQGGGSATGPMAGGNGSFTQVGINATADSVNKLAVASDATLLSHDGDDHRLAINKASASDTASMVFQTGFAGRAEMGLAGDDAFAIRVSADGANWRTALTVDPGQATVSMPGRPFFRAVPSSSSPAPGHIAPLPFDQVLEQTGTGFDPATHTFTAPVAGLYHFSAQVRFDAMPAGGYARIFFRRNGSEEGYQLGHSIAGANHSTNYHSLVSVLTTQLAAGDTITLHGGHVSGGDTLVIESNWCGHLV